MNKKPFNENFTLVNFDELNKKQILNLFTRVLKELDEKTELKLSSEDIEERAKVQDFLSILGVPEVDNENLIKNVSKGHKKSIYPLLYYCLKN